MSSFRYNLRFTSKIEVCVLSDFDFAQYSKSFFIVFDTVYLKWSHNELFSSVRK